MCVCVYTYVYIHNSTAVMTVSITEHNRKKYKHNKRNFWKIPKSILGKISSIIDGGLMKTYILFTIVYVTRFVKTHHICTQWQRTFFITNQ